MNSDSPEPHQRPAPVAEPTRRSNPRPRCPYRRQIDKQLEDWARWRAISQAGELWVSRSSVERLEKLRSNHARMDTYIKDLDLVCPGLARAVRLHYDSETTKWPAADKARALGIDPREYPSPEKEFQRRLKEGGEVLRGWLLLERVGQIKRAGCRANERVQETHGRH